MASAAVVGAADMLACDVLLVGLLWTMGAVWEVNLERGGRGYRSGNKPYPVVVHKPGLPNEAGKQCPTFTPPLAPRHARAPGRVSGPYARYKYALNI